MDSDNWLNKLGPEEGKGKRRQSPAARTVDAGTVQRVARPDTTRAGRYKRKTITLLPGQIQYIDQLAEKNGLGILAMYRWLVDLGLQAYEAGNRPVQVGKVSFDVELKHPTSIVKEEA